MQRQTHIQKSSIFSLDTPKRKYIRQLIQRMGESNQEPFEPIVTDSLIHECQMFVDGETRKGFYQAHWYPFGKDGPILVCHYGLADETDQFTYISN